MAMTVDHQHTNPQIAFVNGTVLTMVPARPRCEVLVIAGGRIVAAGDRDQLGAYPNALQRDLGGRTVCPGFIDAHHHLSIAALEPRWTDARSARSFDELAELLIQHASAEPEAPWIRATRWTDIGTGFVPHRRDLDALELGRPVLVAHYSLHQGVADSRGLDELGLTRQTPDPAAGTIGRDSDGELNGLLVERAWSDAHRRSLSPYDDPERWADHIEVAARRLLAKGITAVHDTACPPEAEAAYRALAAEGRLAVSVLTCPHPAALLGPPDGDRLCGPVTGEGDEMVRVGPLKLFADGGVEPAIEAHIGGTRFSFGRLFGELDEHVEAAVSRGFRVAVHALGNVGLGAALGAFTQTAARHRDFDHRFRVEHACLASPDQLQRLGELGGVAVVQPGFLDHMGSQVERLAFDDAVWLPFGDIARSGATMAASSDCPCTFDEPLRTSAHGATRRTGSGNVLDVAQAVEYEEWLRAYTAGAAYAGGQESERGTLAPGLRADLVVLEGRLDGERPPAVSEVWVAGRLEHQADVE
jgi:predicted amidohydrolase YtcJ